jgi:hypothetical protein
MGLVLAIGGLIALLASAPTPALGSGPNPIAPIRVQIDILPDQSNRFEIQIGRQAWRIRTEGEALARATRRTTVTVWRLSDCAVMARWTARPGSIHWIRIADGTLTVRHNENAEPFGWGEQPRTPTCGLPATDGVERQSLASRESSLPTGFAILAALAMAALLELRLCRKHVSESCLAKPD